MTAMLIFLALAIVAALVTAYRWGYASGRLDEARDDSGWKKSQ